MGKIFRKNFSRFPSTLRRAYLGHWMKEAIHLVNSTGDFGLKTMHLRNNFWYNLV